MLRPTLAASSSTKPSSTNCPDTSIAEAVCTPAVPAPKISKRPSAFFCALPRSTNQNRARDRLPPTITKNTRGCSMPRLRGTPGQRCHNSRPSKTMPYTSTAFPVACSAACPVYLKIARYKPNFRNIGIANIGARAYTHHWAPVGQCNSSSRSVKAIHVATSARTTSTATTTSRLTARGHANTVFCI